MLIELMLDDSTTSAELQATMDIAAGGAGGFGDQNHLVAEALNKARLRQRSEQWRSERTAADVDQVMPQRPNEHLCSITQDVMTDPVVASDGFTYERSAISKWLEDNDTSPKTKERLSSELRPNFDLRKIIQDWEEQACLARSMSPSPYPGHTSTI